MSDSGREWPSEARRTATPVGKECRAVCNPDQSFAKFSIACEACGEVMFEFVHQQKAGTPGWADERRIYAEPVPAQPAAYSWFKPLTKIVCYKGREHHLVPVKDGEDRNMVGRSKPMTTAEFRQWMEQKPVYPNKPDLEPMYGYLSSGEPLKRIPGEYDGLPLGKLLSAIRRKDYAEADAIRDAWQAERPGTICD